MFETARLLAEYAVLEMTSFAILAAAFWLRFRLSVLHQLAFALQIHHVTIQAQLFDNVFFVVLDALVHLGEI